MATKTLMTAQELANRGPELEGYELIRGELVPMTPPMETHGIVCVNVVFQLKLYTKQLGHGIVMCNDTGLQTERDPDTVRGVDVMLFLHRSPPDRTAAPQFIDHPPDLAVEVRSPSDRWTRLVAKAGEYLGMGVRLVWVVDPKARRVTVFTPDAEPQTLAADDTLDGGAVLPGFRVAAAELFEGT